MTDIADKAAEASELFLAQALIRQQQKNVRTHPSTSDCEECGALIPKARTSAVSGVSTCVDCQNLIEAKNMRRVQQIQREAREGAVAQAGLFE